MRSFRGAVRLVVVAAAFSVGCAAPPPVLLPAIALDPIPGLPEGGPTVQHRQQLGLKPPPDNSGRTNEPLRHVVGQALQDVLRRVEGGAVGLARGTVKLLSRQGESSWFYHEGYDLELEGRPLKALPPHRAK